MARLLRHLKTHKMRLGHAPSPLGHVLEQVLPTMTGELRARAAGGLDSGAVVVCNASLCTAFIFVPRT